MWCFLITSLVWEYDGEWTNLDFFSFSATEEQPSLHASSGPDRGHLFNRNLQTVHNAEFHIVCGSFPTGAFRLHRRQLLERQLVFLGSFRVRLSRERSFSLWKCKNALFVLFSLPFELNRWWKCALVHLYTIVCGTFGVAGFYAVNIFFGAMIFYIKEMLDDLSEDCRHIRPRATAGNSLGRQLLNAIDVHRIVIGYLSLFSYFNKFVQSQQRWFEI